MPPPLPPIVLFPLKFMLELALVAALTANTDDICDKLTHSQQQQQQHHFGSDAMPPPTQNSISESDESEEVPNRCIPNWSKS
jgi:hypothetical protein